MQNKNIKRIELKKKKIQWIELLNGSEKEEIIYGKNVYLNADQCWNSNRLKCCNMMCISN